MDIENEAPLQITDDAIGEIYDSVVSDDGASQESNTDQPASENEAEINDVDLELGEQSEETELPDEDQELETEQETESNEPQEEVIKAPQSMSASDREKFYELPPEQQKWLSDRAKEQESAFTKKTMEVAEERKQYERLESILGPRRQQLAMQGMDDSTAIGQLFALSDYASNDPIGFINMMMRDRGIPLEALTQNGGEGQGQVTLDPQYQNIQSELQNVKQYIQQQSMGNQQAEMTRMQSEVEAFANDPAFEYYSDLEADMVPIVEALRAQDQSLQPKQLLEKAYKMALAANEEVSAKAKVDQAYKEKVERARKAKAAAAKAKKAQGTNISSSNSASKGGTPQSVEDFIGTLYDERMTG